MITQDKNLARALKILAADPGEDDVSCTFDTVVVKGQTLCLNNDDDCAVLAILMTNDECIQAVESINEAVKELREMHDIWSTTVNNHNKECKYSYQIVR